MQIQFTKMHGLGNDFMVVDLVSQQASLTPELVRQLADRHTGVGFDQLLTVEPPGVPDADFRYRIYNVDGSEAEHCGNGARCMAQFVRDSGLSPKPELTFEKLGGNIRATLREDGMIEVEMGVPTLEPDEIPFEADAAADLHELTVNGQTQAVTAVGLGNPHAVLMVPDVLRAAVHELGSAIETHPRFPRGVNVGFCQVVDAGFIRLRVHERGVGETRACGSGACAAVVAGRLLGRLGERVKVSLPGGKLRIGWQGPGTSLTMAGEATTVYTGEIRL